MTAAYPQKEVWPWETRPLTNARSSTSRKCHAAPTFREGLSETVTLPRPFSLRADPWGCLGPKNAWGKGRRSPNEIGLRKLPHRRTAHAGRAHEAVPTRWRRRADARPRAHALTAARPSRAEVA